MTKWISIKVQLPTPGQKVIAVYTNSLGKSRIIVASYITAFTEITDCDHDWYETREEDDDVYLPEGWYERIESWHEITHAFIAFPVTHWQTLPPLPEAD